MTATPTRAHPPVRSGRPAPPRRRAASRRLAARVGMLAGMLVVSACAFRTRGSGADASVEIRNTADIGVNLYMQPRTAVGEVFLGQVGPNRSRRIPIPRASVGDTVWLRARPIDGRPEYVRNDIVLGRQSVWRIP